MKKFLLIAIAFFAFAACDDEDTSDLRDELKNQGNRLEMLESEVEALKQKIEGLNQTYKAVTEMLGGGLITKVEEVTGEGGKSGYKLTIQTPEEEGFKIEDYTIWNGESVAGPSLGVVKDGDNGYYWTLDDEPLKDADGNKVYTSGIAPKLRINEGQFEISYDGGASWNDLGVFSGTVAAGSNIQVVKNGNVVVIKQEGKTDIEIPITPANTLGIEFTNINVTAGLSILQNSVYVVKYEPKNAENATVKVEMLNGTAFEVENLPADKKFKITAKAPNASDVVLVHVYDGTVCMHTSFNVTSTSAITASKVVLPLESASVTYPVSLKLPAAITGEIAIITSLGGTLPAGAVTVPAKVEVTNGQATVNVVIDRTSLIWGIGYTLKLLFSKEDAGYPVLGSMEILAGQFKEISLTEEDYASIFAANGNDAAHLCRGASGKWETAYNSTEAKYGDPTYGVYVDVTLPYPIVAVQFKYDGGASYVNKLAIGAENGVWTLLGTQDYYKPAGGWAETSGHAMPDNSLFSKVRFGVTQGKHQGNGPEDGSMTGFLGSGGSINFAQMSDLQVFGLRITN